MTYSDPAAYYHSRLALHQKSFADVSRKAMLISRLRLFAVLAALGFGIAASQSGAVWQWAAAGMLLAVFLVLVRLHGKLGNEQKMLGIRIQLLEAELKGLGGDYSHFQDGAQFTDPAHPYTFDLDIFGAGSLYQLLNRTSTQNGAVTLASLLERPEVEGGHILAQQEMIADLSGQPMFLEDFRAAGAAAEEAPGDYGLVTGWLDAPDHFINSLPAKIGIAVMPLACVALIVYGIATNNFPTLITLAIGVNWILLGVFSKKIKMANAHVGRTARLVEKYQRLQDVAALAGFNHPQLAAISRAAAGASSQVGRFRKLAHMFDSRNNNLAGPLMNSVFLFDIYCLLRLEGWRRAHKALLLQTMEDMILLDVMVSCANYAFNHPSNTYPVFEDGGYTAANLRHPLLEKTAVGNDFRLGADEKIYLLTGANMTGKSTFIRTVGVAAVLSYAGLPVPGASLSLPLMNIYTSIRVTDSVQQDVSYFRAELNRIKAIMDTVKSSERPFLVLLDEPLRGTNSGDKQQGTRAIIESLLAEQVMGIVATHDIGLCILEDAYPGMLRNYHFESTVAADGLAFDFKLYPGGSTSNNATILMRQMGIIQ